jgi:hypothetical protein
MARWNGELAIDNGPSKLDLMLSLFDTDMGPRVLKFYKARDEGRQHGLWIFDVQIVSARRRNPAANIWEIEGITDANDGEDRVSIYYTSDTRKGRMRFEEELRTHGILETSDDSKRSRALMIVIEKIIATYQNSHRGNLDEEVFKLYEKAKRIKFAKDHDSLTEAIKNI